MWRSSIQENDDPRKGKLKTLEEIVTDQGNKIGVTVPVPRQRQTRASQSRRLRWWDCKRISTSRMRGSTNR